MVEIKGEKGTIMVWPSFNGIGYEPLAVRENEDKYIEQITLIELLSNLTPKERETLILWAQRFTLQDIADKISAKYEPNTRKTPLTGRAMGARIKKLLERLKRLAKTT
jgi:hypothetical protein